MIKKFFTLLMFTKIQAAKFATANGVTMLIINGATNGNLRRTLSGEAVGTIFPRRNAQ